MLTDARAVLDDLAAAPGTARRVAASLRAADSPYTLPALITALDQVTIMLARAARDATTSAAAGNTSGITQGVTGVRVLRAIRHSPRWL